jgi:hypothetical protein
VYATGLTPIFLRRLSSTSPRTGQKARILAGARESLHFAPDGRLDWNSVQEVFVAWLQDALTRVADTLTSAGSWKCVKAAAPPDSAAALTSSSKEAGTFSRSYPAITNANRLKEYLQEIQRMKWMKILFDEIDLL